jgi:actin-like ATPase involved in cell morphogenesis
LAQVAPGFGEVRAVEAFSRWHRSLRSDVAIDLGTVNTLVYMASHGLVIDEPSVVYPRTGSPASQRGVN